MDSVRSRVYLGFLRSALRAPKALGDGSIKFSRRNDDATPSSKSSDGSESRLGDLDLVRDWFFLRIVLGAAMAAAAAVSVSVPLARFRGDSKNRFPELVHPRLASIRTQCGRDAESLDLPHRSVRPHAKDRRSEIDHRGFDPGLVDMTIQRAPEYESVLQVPNPRGWNCWVTDQANVLDRSTVEHLNSVIDALKFDTGAEVTVVTIKTCSSNLAAKDFAAELYKRWKIEESHGRGILFLLVASEGKLEVEIGWNAAKILTGSIVKRRILSDLEQEQYDTAIVLAVEGVADKIWESSGFGVPNRASGKWWNIVDLVWLGVIPTLALAANIIFKPS